MPLTFRTIQTNDFNSNIFESYYVSKTILNDSSHSILSANCIRVPAGRQTAVYRGHQEPITLSRGRA